MLLLQIQFLHLSKLFFVVIRAYSTNNIHLHMNTAQKDRTWAIIECCLLNYLKCRPKYSANVCANHVPLALCSSVV